MKLPRRPPPPSSRENLYTQQKNYPVKLGSYMAQRQASKEKQVVSRIRSAELIFRHELSVDEIDKKRNSVLQLIERLIDDLIKKKHAIHNKLLSQLESEEKILQQMLKSVFCRKQRKEGSSIISRNMKSKFELKQPISPIHHVLSDNVNSNRKKFQELIVQIPSFEDVKEKELKHPQIVSQRIKNIQNNSQISRSPYKSTILRNGSVSTLKHVHPYSQLSQMSKVSHLDNKYLSKVKFKD